MEPTSVARAPFITDPDLSVPGIEKWLAPGYRIAQGDLRHVSVTTGIPVAVIAPDPENDSSPRFRRKLRGVLTSYLMDNEGAFVEPDKSGHARRMGIRTTAGDPLPVHVQDAIMLEHKLRMVVARAQCLLRKLDSKFARSMVTIEFAEQTAPGIFERGRHAHNYRELSTIRIGDTDFPDLQAVAERFDIDQKVLVCRIVAREKTVNTMSQSDWLEVLQPSDEDASSLYAALEQQHA